MSGACQPAFGQKKAANKAVEFVVPVDAPTNRNDELSPMR